MASTTNLKNRLATVEAHEGKKQFPVFGFDFTHYDDPTKFDPYTVEAITALGFELPPFMPQDLVYVPEGYTEALLNMKEAGLEHVTNKEHLPWIDI